MLRFLLVFTLASWPNLVRAEDDASAKPPTAWESKQQTELQRLDAALQTACGRCYARIPLPREIVDLVGVQLLCLRPSDVPTPKGETPSSEITAMLVAPDRCLGENAEAKILSRVGDAVTDLPDSVLIELARIIWALRRGGSELVNWSGDLVDKEALAELTGDLSESQLLAIERARNPYASNPYIGCDIMHQPDLEADNASNTFERCPVAAPRVIRTEAATRVEFSCVLRQECRRVYNVFATFGGGKVEIHMTDTKCQTSAHGLVPTEICVKQ